LRVVLRESTAAIAAANFGPHYLNIIALFERHVINNTEAGIAELHSIRFNSLRQSPATSGCDAVTILILLLEEMGKLNKTGSCRELECHDLKERREHSGIK
jgi:hypothetical protein